MTVVLLVIVGASVGCRYESAPAPPPRLPEQDISFTADTAGAWDKTRVTPPEVLDRPALGFSRQYPSGHLPAPRGAAPKITLIVAADGTVERLEVRDWSGVESDQLRSDLLKYLSKWRFRPSRDENGMAVRTEVPITIRLSP